MSDSGKEMLATHCGLRDIPKKLEDMYEKLKAMHEASCKQVKEFENLMMSLLQEVKLMEDQLNKYNHPETQAVDGSERVDKGARSMMADHTAADVAGKDHDEHLGNGVPVTKLLASNARQIANNLDSTDPVKLSSKALAPSEHEVSTVEVAPLPEEGAMLSGCGVGVVLGMNKKTDHFPIQVIDETDDLPVQIMDETNHLPIQVSDPLPWESYSFFALRLTEEAIARIATHATTGQPMPISRADLIVEFVEINIFRQD